MDLYRAIYFYIYIVFGVFLNYNVAFAASNGTIASFRSYIEENESGPKLLLTSCTSRISKKGVLDSDGLRCRLGGREIDYEVQVDQDDHLVSATLFYRGPDLKYFVKSVCIATLFFDRKTDCSIVSSFIESLRNGVPVSGLGAGYSLSGSYNPQASNIEVRSLNGH